MTAELSNWEPRRVVMMDSSYPSASGKVVMTAELTKKATGKAYSKVEN